MTKSIQEKLLKFISRSFMVEPEEIDLDNSLVDTGVIDSFGLIEIAVFMENEFMITVDETDMIRENFGSVVKMTDFISKRVNS